MQSKEDVVDLGCDNHLLIFAHTIITFKAVKTTNADLTVANVNVKMDIQEFIVTLTFQLAQST